MPARRSRSAIYDCIRLACGLLALHCPPAVAQSLSVTGRVSDTTGAPLPGVSVLLRTPDARQRAETVTDGAGKYRLDVGKSGHYELSFTLIAFGQVTKTITVTADQTVVDAVLPLAFTADVTVTGRRTFRKLEEAEDPARSLIGLASAASEGAVTTKQLENRPLQRPGEVLEAVPGLVISQHSGEGKANQYYLRGFNLDHGTDFAVSVAGVPVNMPTHAHGQGWSDANFLIPELVSGIQFKKGPYYAEEGDFSTAGAANINYLSALERPLLRLNTGGGGFGRVVAAVSPRVGHGHLLAAVESGRNNGPWETPEMYRRLNGVVRYSQGDARQAFAITAMSYGARWTATDQIPRRAVDHGVISRFGTLDVSDGGETHRHTVSADLQRSGTSHTTKVVGYAIDYGLDLFSNFTYLLNDPVNGDQFEQVDDRQVFGGRVSHRRQSRWLGGTLEHSLGVQVRHDEIGALGLYSTRERQRLRATREDRVRQTSIGMYYQGELEFTDRLRATAGLRGDLYRFGVQSTRPENAGTEIAGLLSPKFGVVFAPSGTLELYGNFGDGYHSNDGRGTTISVDPMTGARVDTVTPLVRTRGGEVGLRTILIPKVQTTVAVWGLSLDSELVFVGDAGTTEPGRPSRRAGVEWANSYTPRPWLLFDADLSWSSARFTDDDSSGSAIPGAVRHVASVGASVSEYHRISAGLRLRYLGPRPLIEDATVTSRRSLVVNMEAGTAWRRGRGFSWTCSTCSTHARATSSTTTPRAWRVSRPRAATTFTHTRCNRAPRASAFSSISDLGVQPVFVTGGTGYIGRPLIAALLDRGYVVHALVRPGSEAKLPRSALPVLGNALDPSTFASRIPPNATVVHLVGTPHPNPAKAAEFRRVDLASIRATTAAAQQADARHLVYVSVAHPAPVMRAYIAARRAGESLDPARSIRQIQTHLGFVSGSKTRCTRPCHARVGLPPLGWPF